jgi:hypothetical protein
MTKPELIASIRGQLLQAAHDTLLNNLADASVQIQELTAKVKALEDKIDPVIVAKATD